MAFTAVVGLAALKRRSLRKADEFELEADTILLNWDTDWDTE